MSDVAEKTAGRSLAAPAEHRPRSVTIDMAERFGMEPSAFEQTLRATVFPANAPREEFAAFLLVARDYDLNPILREIYAFPKKGGGIQPIVGVDGWLNIINRQPDLDGVEFKDHFDEQKKLTAITCRIFRKDRSHPIEITEYMAECARETEPWKRWPARMLRHKALIQCARYAFGISGIQEPDEYERGETDIGPIPPRPRREDFIAPTTSSATLVAAQTIEAPSQDEDTRMFEFQDSNGETQGYPDPKEAMDHFLKHLELAEKGGARSIDGLWESNSLSSQIRDAGFPEMADKLIELYANALQRAEKATITVQANPETGADVAAKEATPAIKKPATLPPSPFSRRKDKAEWPQWAAAFKARIQQTSLSGLDDLFTEFKREVDYIAAYRTKDHDDIQALIADKS